MPSRKEISKIYDDFLFTLDDNFVPNQFIFGFSISMLILLITTQFIENIPTYVISLLSLATSLFFSFFQYDLTQIMNFFDIPFALIASFLFVRLCMSLSRTILNYSSGDETVRRSITMLISFVSSCLTMFIVYNTIEKVNIVILVYVLDIIAFLVTLALDNGVISDPCFVVAYSILFVSKDDELSTFISVVRFLFLILSFISLLVEFPTTRLESFFQPISLKGARTRILLLLSVSSYLYISPNLMWQHGCYRCEFQSIATPIIYMLLCVYEYYQTNDQSFYGYN